MSFRSTEPVVAAATTRRGLGEVAEALRDVANAVRSWLRGATGSTKYESYLRHAAKCGHQPLSEQEFYLEDVKRKYSRPNRCC